MNAKFAKETRTYKFGRVYFHGGKLSAASVKAIQGIALKHATGVLRYEVLRDVAQAFKLKPGKEPKP
jgi:hypothetical protein